MKYDRFHGHPVNTIRTALLRYSQMPYQCMYDSNWLDKNEDAGRSANATPNDFKLTDTDIPNSLLKNVDLKAIYPDIV